jgi:hypothetical protein
MLGAFIGGGASDSEGIKCAFVLVTLMWLNLGLLTPAWEHLAVEAGSVGKWTPFVQLFFYHT